MPDYDESSHDKVVLRLPGSVIDENYSQLLIERHDLTLSETVLLDRVQKHKPISSQAIDMLRKKNLVEGRKPNVFVAKDIAKDTDHKVEYSQHKGLNDQQYTGLDSADMGEGAWFDRLTNRPQCALGHSFWP